MAYSAELLASHVKKEKEVRKVFDQYDKHGTGTVDSSEVRQWHPTLAKHES